MVALWYVEHGLTLIRLKPGSKKPWTSGDGWVTTTDPAEVRRWFDESPDTNVGIVCSPETRTVIVDADTYKGVEGSVEGLDLPVTLTTEGRGVQYIYRTDGRPVRTHAPGRRHVQVLGSSRQYGACPPSIHPGDRDADIPLDPFPYKLAHKAPPAMAPEFVYLDEDELAEAVEVALLLPTAPENPPEARLRPAKGLDAEQELRKAQALLRGIEAKGPWDQRHRRDFAFALACLGAGVSEACWREVVLAIPRSKARDSGRRSGDKYLTRSWARAVEEAAKSTHRPSVVPKSLIEWSARIDALAGVTGRERRVLRAVADLAIARRSETVAVPNRVLREMSGVTTGKVVSDALWWAERKKILKEVDRASSGGTAPTGRVVQLRPIPDHLLAAVPVADDYARTSTQVNRVLRIDQETQGTDLPGSLVYSPSASSTPPMRDAGTGADPGEVGASPARQGGHLLPHRPPPHVSSGFVMTVPRDTQTRWMIPADHEAFHRSALGPNSASVLLALALGPMRPKDLAPRLNGMSVRTMYRALDKLEASGIVTKTLFGEWGIASLAPLDRIASQAGLGTRSTSLAMAHDLDRDDHLRRQADAQFGRPRAIAAHVLRAAVADVAPVPIGMSLVEALMATPHGPSPADGSVTEQRRAARRRRAYANERRNMRRPLQRAQRNAQDCGLPSADG